MPFVPFDFNAPSEGGMLTAGSNDGVVNAGQESPGRVRWRESEGDVTLLSYWKFDETSGTAWDDSHNGNDLTGGSDGFDTGKISNAVKFNDNPAQWANIEPPTSVLWDWDAGITICGWLKFTATDSTTIGDDIFEISKFFGNNWRLYIHTTPGSNAIQFNALTVPGASHGLSVSGLMGSGFNFIRWWISPDSQRMHLRINEANQQNSSTTITPFTPEQPDRIQFNGLKTGAGFVDTLWDEWGIWEGVMGPGNGGYLYNHGNGRTYPDVPGV